MDYLLDLHMFDGEGGGAAAPTSAAPGATTPVVDTAKADKPTKVQLAERVYGAQAQANPAETGAQELPEGQPADGAPEESFDDLIKGKYKADYDRRVQEQLQRRFKQQEQLTQRAQQLDPIVSLLANKYGVDPKDTEALTKAVESDEALYEVEAAEQGMPVAQFKRMKQMERENAQFKAAAEARQSQANADRIYGEWMQQTETAKAIYPSLDFEVEAANPDFAKLLRAGVDVRAAYEVVHRDEIISGAMQFTAQTVAQKVASNVQARGSRPQENGMGSQSPSVVRKAHASDLSRADVLEVARRAKAGNNTQF